MVLLSYGKAVWRFYDFSCEPQIRINQSPICRQTLMFLALLTSSFIF